MKYVLPSHNLFEQRSISLLCIVQLLTSLCFQYSFAFFHVKEIITAFNKKVFEKQIHVPPQIPNIHIKRAIGSQLLLSPCFLSILLWSQTL